MRDRSIVVGDAGDYAAVNSVKEAASVFWIESLKLWKIAAPLLGNCVFSPLTPNFSLSLISLS
ncbi:hypothetical protein BVRB_9g204060 [Beta vulgaris subsp. vulgaris]|nr:hypothetical protein BVRB_9g204060 [Beta vulgaris subsp. vulgaris]